MRHNFTLFELLLIVGVIAIAAAMMHPMLSAARDAAAEAGCRSNLSLFSKAATSYSTDNDNWAITGYLGAQTGNWFHVFENPTASARMRSTARPTRTTPSPRRDSTTV